MKIIIKADGGLDIGMGHIMRTLVLAQSLKKYAEIEYVCKSGEKFCAGTEYIRNKGLNVIEVDEDNTFEKLANISADCLITDSYDVDENYFKTTNKIFSITGYIDDLNCFKIEVDFIINQNAYARDLKYVVGKNTQLFWVLNILC